MRILAISLFALVVSVVVAPKPAVCSGRCEGMQCGGGLTCPAGCVCNNGACLG